ncbi:hypothetical protein ES703_116902 [subsurface metagenome]
MGISPDNHLSRQHQPLLGQEHVLDAHLAHFEVYDSLLAGELPHQLGLLGGGDVLVGDEVVGHHHHLLRVEDPLYPQLMELPDGDGGGDVVGHDQVNPDVDKIAGAYPFLIGVSRQYLLG